MTLTRNYIRMLVPAGEKVVENKSCRSCGTDFVITDRDVEFYDKVSPVFNGKKESIPTPTLCPECRSRRRMAWRNERKLYRRKCDMTGQDIVSIYSPDKPDKVYEQSIWQSDRVDAIEYGRDFDFSRSFGEQFADLLRDVPVASVLAGGIMEDSEYNNFCGYLKRCYMCFDAGKSEDVYYATLLGYCKDSMDLLGCSDLERSYECVDVTNSYSVYYCRSVDHCRESAFLLDCVGCSHCLGCANLSNQSYRIFNETVSPEEFDAAFQAVFSSHGAREEFRQKALAFFRKQPVKSLSGNQNESVSWDIITQSKRIKSSYWVFGAEDCAYCSDIFTWAKGCYDIDSFAENSELCLEHTGSGGKVGVESLTKSGFGVYIFYGGYNVWYSTLMSQNCRDCFGCTGLKWKRHCILNKQYTEEEYNELVPKIIEHMRQTGEWWEFFSPSLSPFGYNETVAMEYFPLSRDEAIKQGFNWSDYEAPFPKVEKIIPANKLPENIKDIPDDILNWAIECEVTRKPYRIIKQELDFYRKHSLPIPRRHPDQRHLDRLALRNPRRLHERTCDNCSKPIVTTYSPDRPERVYCQDCYEREVYG